MLWEWKFVRLSPTVNTHLKTYWEQTDGFSSHWPKEDEGFKKEVLQAKISCLYYSPCPLPLCCPVFTIPHALWPPYYSVSLDVILTMKHPCWFSALLAFPSVICKCLHNCWEWVQMVSTLHNSTAPSLLCIYLIALSPLTCAGCNAGYYNC